MFFSTLLVLSSVLGLSTALPIHYQSSFDSPAFQVSTPVSHSPTPATFSMFWKSDRSGVDEKDGETADNQNELHQCKPSQFSWTPTTGPYYLSITSTSINTAGVKQTDQGETVVVPHGTSASWVVDVEEGSTVSIEVRDSEGQVAKTVMRTVLGGPEHCL